MGFEEKRYLQKFCFFFPDLFLSRGFTKKMSIQNQKNVQKNRKILKNLLMYDKKNHLSPTPNNNNNKNPKKTPSPKKKKLERKKKKKNTKKKKKGKPKKKKKKKKKKS